MVGCDVYSCMQENGVETRDHWNVPSIQKLVNWNAPLLRICLSLILHLTVEE